MQFVEDFALTSPRRTTDGYLVADVRCARTGIQQYAGIEVGRPDLPVVSVYRPESSVFNTASMQTFGGKPVTDGHPSEPVSSRNWKTVAKGYIGEQIARDGDFVRAPIILMDEETIQKVEKGTNQLSMGYTADLQWGDGLTSSGQPYQATQQNIGINHLAIVDAARAGSQCRIGDTIVAHPLQQSQPQTIYQKSMPEKTILIDGLSVVTTEQGAQAIEKLQGEIATLKTNIKTLTEDRDRNLAERDAQIRDLKTQILDEDAILAKANARMVLVDQARILAPDADFSKLTKPEEIRRAALSVKDAQSIEGKSDVYVEVLFDQMIKNHKPEKLSDKVADAISNRQYVPLFDQKNDHGQGDYNKRISEAWKNAK